MNARHIASPTNLHISLHQEYWMRTGAYDSDAHVESARHGYGPDGSPTTFHGLVVELGLEQAIRDVASCHWLSESDWSPRDFQGGTCQECLEVAHS